MEAPLPQPTAQNPLTILEIGDSLGQDLGFGLGDDVFANDPFLHIIQAAVGDTGLARPDYYDWPAHLETELQQDHPGAVVVFLGGNDGQGFTVNGQVVEFGTPLWHEDYAARVALVMSECLAAKARVLWVGMPIMGPSSLTSVMAQLDAIFRAEAAKHPGATYFSSWSLFSNAEGQYTPSEVVNGQEQVVRDSDGVHLTSYGDILLASALIGPMEKAWGIKVQPASGG
jgi:hypothetical protein